jgi:uncharacterized membrane protein YjjB (DUF3815 family)
MAQRVQEDQQTQQQPHKRGTVNLTPSQVAASALAASCSALVASYLGVAGTVIGAAIGSVIATTCAALYSHAFRTGGKKLAALAPAQGAGGRSGERSTTAGSEGSAEATDPKNARSTTPDRASGRRRYGKRIALAVTMVAVFAVAITIGFLAGGPIRQAAAGGGISSQTSTSTVTVTRSAERSGTGGSTADPSATGSTSGAAAPPSATSTPPTSASGSATPSASSTGGGTASGGNQVQNTATATSAAASPSTK